MSNYNWCHNDKCHTYHTTDRIRGSKGNKVLRTRKDKGSWGIALLFYKVGKITLCKVGCLFDYGKKHIDRIVEIAPVREPSETPIEVKTEKVQEYRFKWNSNGDHERVPYISTKQKIIS